MIYKFSNYYGTKMNLTFEKNENNSIYYWNNKNNAGKITHGGYCIGKEELLRDVEKLLEITNDVENIKRFIKEEVK